ncbi:MAG: hypothetical protein K0S47_364 [Herbinix sp.]|jgi:hypothetical protein|nr:hypothetical protein [Herbinix sp.]
MQSIKPGRGPSMMGFVGSIAAALFGIFWTFTALSIGAPGLFGLFGLVFIGMAVVNGIYNLKNATGKNRFSMYDITNDKEEQDPLNEIYGKRKEQGINTSYHENSTYTDTFDNSIYNKEKGQGSNESRFCPYCGTRVENDYEFCNQCGKKLP